MQRARLATWISLLLLIPGIFISAAEEEPKVKINFAGIDLVTVAKQVERITKRSFLYDENTLRNKRVTLQSDGSIGADEFYRVFQAVCQMNGLSIISVEGAGIKLEKIVSAQSAFKEPGMQQVLVRGEQLPSGDALVSYLVKLKHTSVTKVMAVLTPVLSANGSALQVPNTDLLMINDAASSLKRAEKILLLLDVPGETVVTAAVQIVHIDTDKAQRFLSEYVQALAKVKTGDAPRDRLAMLKDERLNILHLIGIESEVKQAQAFLKTIDVESPGQRRTIRYYKLNNVPVKDIVDYVSQLLGVALQARTQTADIPVDIPAAQPSLDGAVRPRTEVPLPAPLLPPRAAVPRASRVPGLGSRSGKDDLPADIIPVDGLNTLVVAGDETVHREVEGILKNLDRRKGQVLIEVAIVQVNGDGTLDLGVEGIRLKGSNKNEHFADVGTGFGIGKQGDPEGRGFPTESIISGITGSAFRFTTNDKLEVLVSALATKSNVSIVSQPLLLVNDNEDASFTTKVSQPTVTTSQGTATTNTSFSGFADATTSLKITPHISPDGYLNLEIEQTFEEFTGAPAGAGIPPPKVSNNASTRVSIPDRETIVIGGFTRDSSIDTASGVPGLMRIPGVGKLFSRENKSKTTSRLYLFVRPKILTKEGFGDLGQESEEKKRDVKKLSRDSEIKCEINEKLNHRADIIESTPEDADGNSGHVK